jgi:acyl-CoA synthetase (NDP forming)
VDLVVKDKILVALDVESGADAIRLADGLRDAVGGFKIGSRLFTAEGPAIVRTLTGRGDRVFLDLKFHDIPNTVATAVAAAAELGYPVVVKSAAAGAHKTETGGVALDLENDAAVRAAVERIGFPVVVQPMLRGGTELLAGLIQDPVFGPLVAFGPGGVYAELIGEAGLRVAPLTDIDAEELITAGKAGRLVRGFRGAAPADAAALVDLVHRLAALGEDLPAVAELDLNPVLGFPDRAVAVDARVRIRRPQEQRREKSW